MTYFLKEGIDTRCVKKFDYIHIDNLKIHENYIFERTNSLFSYIKSCTGVRTIPSVIVCHQTLVVLDGHHRLQVLKELGYKLIPCLLVDYEDPSIIVHPHNREISKELVIKAGLMNEYLPPKTTQHSLVSSSGKLYPIIILSPIVYIETIQGDEI